MSDSGETDKQQVFRAHYMSDSPEADKYRIKNALRVRFYRIGHARRHSKNGIKQSIRQIRTTSRMGQGAHLFRIDDLLVFAAFLRTFGTFERVDLLPTGEVDRLDTARLQQSVD